MEWIGIELGYLLVAFVFFIMTYEVGLERHNFMLNFIATLIVAISWPIILVKILLPDKDETL
jgi:hypothetical protein